MLERTTIINGVRYVNVHALASATGYTVTHLQERSRDNGRGHLIPALRSVEFGYRGRPTLWFEERLIDQLRAERAQYDDAILMRGV